MRLHETGDAFENAIKYRDDFIKWWRSHSVVGPPQNGGKDPNYLQNKIEVVHDNAGFKINCGWKLVIEDNSITQLPFRFGKVGQMRLSAAKLTTLAGAPEECNMFSLERVNDSGGLDQANSVLENITHGPKSAEHMSIELARPLRSLHTNFTHAVDTVWIHAPSIVSFEGLNVHCNELTCTIPFQKSISGIHKQLQNVENLVLALNPAFEGGLLGLAMIKGLKSVGGSFAQKGPWVNPTPNGCDQALTVVNQAIAQKMNVHELQEKMIELGLGKFARL
jgi:hypothetical protein